MFTDKYKAVQIGNCKEAILAHPDELMMFRRLALINGAEDIDEFIANESKRYMAEYEELSEPEIMFGMMQRMMDVKEFITNTAKGE